MAQCSAEKFLALSRTLRCVGLVTLAHLGIVSVGQAAADVKPPKRFSERASIDLKAPTDHLPLKVLNIRLDRADLDPFTTLRFEVLNDGVTRLTDVILNVSIVEKSKPVQSVPQREPVATYTIRGREVVLQPGYLLNYEMRLRNFPSDCDCQAVVEVESVRSLADITPSPRAPR